MVNYKQLTENERYQIQALESLEKSSISGVHNSVALNIITLGVLSLP